MGFSHLGVGQLLVPHYGGNLLPYTLDFSQHNFEGAWTAPNWTIDGTPRTAKNTPTEAVTNLFSNPEFTTNTIGWSMVVAGALSRVDSTSDPGAASGGADSWVMKIAHNGTNNPTATTSVTPISGVWYVLSFRAYAPSTNTAVNAAKVNTGGGLGGITNMAITAEDVWQLLRRTVRATSGAAVSVQPVIVTSTSGDTGYFDSFTAKALSNILAYRNFNAANVIVKAPWTIAAGYQAGVVARVNAAGTNYIYGYHDRTNAILVKVVGATVTGLISAAVAYAAGANVEIRTSGNNVELWYNNAQVGTTQAVTDVEVTNTRHGLFSTDVSNTVASLSVVAN